MPQVVEGSVMERAARALYHEAYRLVPMHFEYADADDDKTILDGAYDLKDLVRAVLQAIRTPSGGMANAGAYAGFWDEAVYDQDPVDRHEYSTDVWQAMIDQALSE